MPLDPQHNPFVSPTAPDAREPASNFNAGAGRVAVARQAVRFSLYSPILLTATNLVVRDSLGADHYCAKLFAIFSATIIGIGLLLGIVGALGSLRRFCLWDVFVGLFGALLNGALIVGSIGAWMR